MTPLYSDPRARGVTLAQLARITICRDMIVTCGEGSLLLLPWQVIARNMRLSPKKEDGLRRLLVLMLQVGFLEDVEWGEDGMISIEGAAWFLETAAPSLSPDLSEAGRSTDYTREQARERQRRRRERLRKLQMSAGVTQKNEIVTLPVTPECVTCHDSESDSESDQMDSIDKNQSKSDSDRVPVTPLLRVTHAPATPAYPDAMEPLAQELRRDPEGWTEAEIAEAIRRKGKNGKKVEFPLPFLRKTLVNLRAEWAQQKMVMLAQAKGMERPHLPREEACRNRPGDTINIGAIRAKLRAGGER